MLTDTEDKKPTQLLRIWLNAVEELVAVPELFADDIVLHVPFVAPGMPPRTEGRDEVTKVMAMLGQMFERFRYTDLEVYQTDDPELAVGRAGSEATLVGGANYRGNYVFFLRARGGKIVEYFEYMDVLAGQRAVEGSTANS
ncbi:nuclear transport factor 2 family protein [Nocardia pseudovaccinii]|uniref:nuclear transport factor 2 family protein n=1 Tax=Nocardia pseudovaccinii TaxID=189540 RepID=UPI0007A3870D|nr:nuclear transport factor 2 family protein [Nocardia pseudovaccinii]